MINLNIPEYLEQYLSPLVKSDDKMQPNKGVQQSYKDVANNSANVMFRAKIKGQTHLDDNIPLHVTLKTFDKPDKMPLDEVHQKVKELGIERPEPKELAYEPITFTSPKSGNTYYMLRLHGTSPAYKHFNDHFKGQGITHDNYMAHVTINKDLYDKIKKEGLKPNEIEFSPLMIEHGANNPTHIFPDSKSGDDHKSDITPKYTAPTDKKIASSEKDMDDMSKGFKDSVAGAAMAGIMATASPTAMSKPLDHQPKAGSHEIQASIPSKQIYDRQTMLHAIADVESSNGKNTHHKPMGGMHDGETAFGKYGLTPITIRETIKLNRDLSAKHHKAMMLEGNDLKHYVQDNPGLEDEIASKHLSRLEHHFGQDPSKIGYAWLNGISGTNKAKKDNKNIDDHWHVKKINDAYHKASAKTIASN
jgi:hypothetical protein